LTLGLYTIYVLLKNMQIISKSPSSHIGRDNYTAKSITRKEKM